MEVDYDVIVVGGGPAGGTAACVLAEKGRKVVVLEKEKFPRYHIGESLMPFCYFTLERLGLVETLKKSAYPKKYSVQFARADGEISQPFYFFQHMDHDASMTWQVPRSEFDLMILNRARTLGAEVREETAAKRLLKDGDAVTGVVAQNGSGEEITLRAPITIDATGRDCLSAVKQGWRIRDPELKKISIWTYYEGAKIDPGLDAGATTVAYIDNRGWFWYIPMKDNRVSVGIVAERDYLYKDTRDLREIFEREIKNNGWIEDHLSVGKQVGEYWVTGEFSYRSRHCASDGLVLAGDAFAFLDPVFSSGVFLALWSGEKAGDAVDAALESGDYSARQFSDYGKTMCAGIENMRRLVYAFYDENFSFGKLIKKYPDLRGLLTDCLIGDLFDKDYTELFNAVGEFAELPEALEHGCPMP